MTVCRINTSQELKINNLINFNLKWLWRDIGWCARSALPAVCGVAGAGVHDWGVGKQNVSNWGLNTSILLFAGQIDRTINRNLYNIKH